MTTELMRKIEELAGIAPGGVGSVDLSIRVLPRGQGVRHQVSVDIDIGNGRWASVMRNDGDVEAAIRDAEVRARAGIGD